MIDVANQQQHFIVALIKFELDRNSTFSRKTVAHTHTAYRY